MSNVNRELSLIEQQKMADRVREQVRARGEAEARKLQHTQRNVTTYSPMGVLPLTLQQQLQERAQGRREQSKPKTPEEKAASFDVRNAVANLRAAKGIEAPEFVGETEYLPSADDVLAGIVGEPNAQAEVEAAPAPTSDETVPRFNLRDYAEQLIREGQAVNMRQAMGKAVAASNRAKKAAKES